MAGPSRRKRRPPKPTPVPTTPVPPVIPPTDPPTNPPTDFLLVSAVQEIGGTGVMVTIRRLADNAECVFALHDADFGGPPF